MTAEQKEYIRVLLAQDKDNICPCCYADGQRAHLCTNMVYIADEGQRKLVCCHIGDKGDLSDGAWKPTVAEMRAALGKPDNSSGAIDEAENKYMVHHTRNACTRY